MEEIEGGRGVERGTGGQAGSILGEVEDRESTRMRGSIGRRVVVIIITTGIILRHTETQKPFFHRTAPTKHEATL